MSQLLAAAHLRTSIMLDLFGNPWLFKMTAGYVNSGLPRVLPMDLVDAKYPLMK
jgi:hypothetical protein